MNEGSLCRNLKNFEDEEYLDYVASFCESREYKEEPYSLDDPEFRINISVNIMESRVTLDLVSEVLGEEMNPGAHTDIFDNANADVSNDAKDKTIIEELISRSTMEAIMKAAEKDLEEMGEFVLSTIIEAIREGGETCAEYIDEAMDWPGENVESLVMKHFFGLYAEARRRQSIE